MSSSSSSLQSTALALTELGFSSSSSSSAAAAQDAGNKMMLVNTLLTRITNTTVSVSDAEGVALSRVFYTACADAGQMPLFEYTLTLPKFQSWWWAAQKKNTLADLRTAIANDNAAALTATLSNMPSGAEGKKLRTSIAIDCVRRRAKACWEVVTREGTVVLSIVPAVSNSYLDVVLTHDVPHCMLQDGLLRIVHAVRTSDMALEDACTILQVVHVRAAIDSTQTVRMLNMLVDAQLKLLQIPPSAPAAASAAAPPGEPVASGVPAAKSSVAEDGDSGRIRTRAASEKAPEKAKRRREDDEDEEDEDESDEDDIHKASGIRAAMRRYFVSDDKGALTIDDIRAVLQKISGTPHVITGSSIGWAIRHVFKKTHNNTCPYTYHLRHIPAKE